jgi:hypothetical protein
VKGDGSRGSREGGVGRSMHACICPVSRAPKRACGGSAPGWLARSAWGQAGTLPCCCHVSVATCLVHACVPAVQVMTYGLMNNELAWVRQQQLLGVHGAILDDVSGVCDAIMASAKHAQQGDCDDGVEVEEAVPAQNEM